MLNPQYKLLRHSGLVREWLEYGKISRPILIEIDPTGYCNADCPWCFYHKKKTGANIDALKLVEAIKKLEPLAVNWTGGGEPTLHPDFNWMVQQVDDLGVEQGLFTNCIKDTGTDPSKFKWIRVSLTDKYFDVIDQKLFDRYTKGTKVGVNLNLTMENSKIAEDLCIAARDWGADYFQVRPALERRETKVPPVPDIEKYSTDKFRVFTTPYKFEEAGKPHGYKNCYGYHFCPVIDYNGDVRVCNYHLDKYKLGNIDTMQLEIPKSVPVCDDCQICCKNHEINKVLDSLKNDYEDENFL